MCTEQVGRRGRKLLGRALARVQVPKAAVAGHHVDDRRERTEIDPVVAFHVHLTVVRGDDEHGVARQRREQITDESVRVLELAFVEAVVQTELVRDVVDARVVRVHEAIAGRDQPDTVLDEHRDRAPPDESRASEVGIGEPAVAELRLRDDRNVTAEERGVALHVEGIGRAGVRARPAQDVQHLARDDHPVPEHAVLRGREPGADRGQCGRGRRRDDRRDRAARSYRRWSAGGPCAPASAFQPSPSSTSSTTALARHRGLRKPVARRGRPQRARARFLRPTRRREQEAPVPSQVTGADPSAARATCARHASMSEGEGVDAWRLRRPGPALARPARQRTADVGEGDRGADAPAPALSRADPARGEGRRPRALEARRRRRLRARAPGRTRSRSPTSSPRSKGPQLPLAEHPDHCEGHCILQEVWVCVSDETRRYLEQVTLAELVERTMVGHPGADRPVGSLEVDARLPTSASSTTVSSAGNGSSKLHRLAGDRMRRTRVAPRAGTGATSAIESRWPP